MHLQNQHAKNLISLLCMNARAIAYFFTSYVAEWSWITHFLLFSEYFFNFNYYTRHWQVVSLGGTKRGGGGKAGPLILENYVANPNLYSILPPAPKGGAPSPLIPIYFSVLNRRRLATILLGKT